MSDTTIAERIASFLDELAIDAVEERVVEYVIRETSKGRKFSEVLHDPYVRNRLSDEKLQHVLENPEVIEVVEAAIASAFETKDFGFPE